MNRRSWPRAQVAADHGRATTARGSGAVDMRLLVLVTGRRPGLTRPGTNAR